MRTVLVVSMLVLAAAPVAVGTDHTTEPSAGGSVNNVAPTITSVAVNGGNDITPTAGSTTLAITISIVVADDNGEDDIASVDWTVKDPSAATFASGSLNNGQCSGTGATLTCSPTFTVPYYTTPGTYTFLVTVTDAAGAYANNTASPATRDVNTLVALSLGGSSIAFGNVNPGAQSAIQTLDVNNQGNVVIDIRTSGTDLTLSSPSATIGVGAISYSLASNMASSTALTSSLTAIETFDLAKATSGAGSAKSTYWRLTMPSGSTQFIPPGSYTGTITIEAVQS